MDTLFQDVRGGVRLLFKHRWLTAIAILMLALGIGMNAAIFSVASVVLLRPLAIAEPERLLFGVTPTDDTLYAVAAVVVLTVSALASYWPARQAMAIDPIVALRQ
jgi:ABC-type antimicrobial peptide transport system permease subunit